MKERDDFEDIAIPEFLKLSDEQRKAGWMKPAPKREEVEIVDPARAKAEAEQAEAKRMKALARIAKMKTHKSTQELIKAGATWDVKTARWTKPQESNMAIPVEVRSYSNKTGAERGAKVALPGVPVTIMQGPDARWYFEPKEITDMRAVSKKPTSGKALATKKTEGAPEIVRRETKGKRKLTHAPKDARKLVTLVSSTEFEADVREHAVKYVATKFLGRGKGYDTRETKTLVEAQANARKMGTGTMIKAFDAAGNEAMISGAKIVPKPETLDFPENAPPKGKSDAKPYTGKSVVRSASDWVKAEEQAAKGVVPLPPDFSADTHRSYRGKLNEVIALVEAKDVKGLKANTVQPASSSRKAICKYRDLAIKALQAQK